MGRRTDRARTPELWIATNELSQTGHHSFYHRLNQVREEHGFDDSWKASARLSMPPGGTA
jgi:hypothetical protein